MKNIKGKTWVIPYFSLTLHPKSVKQYPYRQKTRNKIADGKNISFA